MKSLKIIFLSFVLLFFVGGNLLAHEGHKEHENSSIEEPINLDENIKAQDLGISEPKILPDNPFYFLKNWARGIQEIFTFNPVKKLELKLKFTNEKLMETRKLIELKRNAKIIKKATENYQKEIEEIKNQADRIKEKAKENPKIESFLDKFIHQQTLHQKLLDRLENQVSPEAFEKIKEAREKHLERFQEVMLKLEDRKEKITEKLDKILEEQKGSQFKNFKNLEVLKNLEEKVPEEAKEAIKKAQENALKRLQGDLEKMSPEDQERFKEYIEKISGEKEKQLEILEDLKTVPLQVIPETLREKLEVSREKILEKIETKLEKLDCPNWIPPAPGFCEKGRIVVEKDPETDCPLPPRCIIPGETEIPEKPTLPALPAKPGVCITLWNPVCGKDGKTYSNECFAELAGVAIDYNGECRETERRMACPDLWDPVCGKDGKTYSNECYAKTAGVEIDYKGVCKNEKLFSDIEKPFPQPTPAQPCPERYQAECQGKVVCHIYVEGSKENIEELKKELKIEGEWVDENTFRFIETNEEQKGVGVGCSCYKAFSNCRENIKKITEGTGIIGSRWYLNEAAFDVKITPNCSVVGALKELSCQKIE